MQDEGVRCPTVGGRSIGIARDLFDQMDDVAAECGLLDLHEGLAERQSISGGKESGHIVGRAGIALGMGRDRRAFKKELNGYLEDIGNVH